MLDAGAVVPAAIEDDDFAGRGKMRDVALHVHLAFFAIGRRRQRHHAEDTRADALGDGADGAAFTRAVAPLEYDDDAQAGVLDPVLEHAQLGLKPPKLLLISLVFQRGCAVAVFVFVHDLPAPEERATLAQTLRANYRTLVPPAPITSVARRR